MALFPCNERVICPGSDSPISNWSSEDPDLLNFAALKFPIWNPNNPINGGDTTSWLPTWLAAGCTGICVSTISLDDAKLCAQRAAFICANTPASGAAPAFFYNTFQSCAFTCPDGTLFVWNIVPGTFVDLSVEQANQRAQAYACKQAAGKHVCIGAFSASCCLGQPYSSTVKLDGLAPIGVELTSGTLPPGLGLSENFTGTTLTLSGTPTQAGLFTFTLAATDANGNFIVKTVRLGVLDITNAQSLPPFSGAPYSGQLTGAGGTAPYFFLLAGGVLPTGLSLASDGTISGTAITNTEETFLVLMRDTSGGSCIESVTLTPGFCSDFFTTQTWTNADFAFGTSTAASSLVGNVITLEATAPDTTGGAWNAEQDVNFPNGGIPATSPLDCTITVQVDFWLVTGTPTRGFFITIQDQNTAAVYLAVNQTDPLSASYLVHFPAGAKITGGMGIQGANVFAGNSFAGKLTITLGV